MNFSGISNRSLAGKLLRLPLKLLPKGAVLPILQGPCRGRKWITGATDHGAWIGSYERLKFTKFAQCLQPASLVYDVGANVGIYSLLASVRAPQGHVYAFEPLPRNLEFLRAHVKMNHLANVTVVPQALSDQTGVARFAASAAHSAGSLTEAGGFEVTTTTLDDFCLSHRPPTLMKIDVEGAEARVLAGAVNTLRQYRPVIFLATHGAAVHRQCCEMLARLNYSLQALDNGAVDDADEILAFPNT